ncbi:hypothetical protein PG997_007219 [Apiospora hydei]|uniref:F-box domain-containing protein n=1 Tax=Apiospora hydei TaxID=1337664 RepID=A0ABR1WA65_9PEZI
MSTPSKDPTAAPSSPSSTSYLDLGNLFHSLPAELRERIFATLLVRSVKWALEHALHCARRTVYPAHAPIQPQFGDGYPHQTPTPSRAPSLGPTADGPVRL